MQSKIGFGTDFKIQRTKKCPYCGNHLSFVQFLRRFRSDALAVHQSTLGILIKEHRCVRCLKCYRLEYHLQVLEQEFDKYTAVLLAAAAITFMLARLYLGAGFFSAIGAAACMILAVGPIVISRIKYESAEIYPLMG